MKKNLLLFSILILLSSCSTILNSNLYRLSVDSRLNNTKLKSSKKEAKQSNKSDINLTLSIPYINNFNLQPDDYGTRINTGFWGVSGGLEYFYEPKKYIGLKYITAIDFFVPVPASPGGEITESMSTSSLELTDNYKLGRFNLGYGINYSTNKWYFTDEIDTGNEMNIMRKNTSIGITANTYFKLRRSFYIGIIYRPTFYRIKPTTHFKYEHLISLDLAWKIPLRRR